MPRRMLAIKKGRTQSDSVRSCFPYALKSFCFLSSPEVLHTRVSCLLLWVPIESYRQPVDRISSVYLLVQRCSGTNTIASSSTFLFAYVCTATRLTIALFGCLLLDLINLTALHLNTFYIYAVRLLAFQTRTIVAAWRLCRNASKWNPLRGRVDTVLDMCPVERASMTRSTGRTLSNAPATISSQPPVHTSEDTHLDRLFVATLLGFAVGLCLLPTTLAFYLVFTAVSLGNCCLSYFFILRLLYEDWCPVHFSIVPKSPSRDMIRGVSIRMKSRSQCLPRITVFKLNFVLIG
ncbi:unnamed protein product [Dicrocoelium dendriticum]|nr:unnamed protein product [Dicrocoelium dendriticum]